jgi:hypothetical protein
MEDPTTAPAAARTRRSITKVGGTLNATLKSETDTKNLTGLGRLGCPPALRSEYLLDGNLSPRMDLSHQDLGDTLDWQ